MVSLTDKITEDQIRILVSESRSSANPLSMLFTYKYAASLVPLNWCDLLYAIENNFLAHQSAIEYALIEAKKTENPPSEVLELACMLQSEAEFPYDVCQLVNKLATLHKSTMVIDSDSKEKFLYVSLNWIYEHKDDYYNPIEIVDVLCDDINYPDEVKKLLSFMPESEPVFDRLVVYLENQRKRWAPITKL